MVAHSASPDDEAPAWEREEEGTLPPEIVASPVQVPRELDAEITWWRPSWRDAYRHVGWRWVFLLPAAGLVLLALLGLRWPGFWLVFAQVKLVALAVGIALSLTGYLVRRAARARKEPFCIYCGYCLTGLPDNYRCPECGRPYTWRLIEEYRRDPQWFIERHKAGRQVPRATPFEAGPVRRRRGDGTE